MGDDKQLLQPLDANGNPIQRAMGVPIVEYQKRLGSAVKFVDMIDFSDSSVYNNRVFSGFHVQNPSGSGVDILVAIGTAFTESVCAYVTEGADLVFDQQTFGPGVLDEKMGIKANRLRMKLSTSSGTLSSGTIDYSGSGNPTDGMTLEINGVIYEFHDDSSVTAGNVAVAIGATADDSYTNLINKTNSTEQAVTATIDTGTDVVTITSNYGGTTGDAITIADGSTGAAFSGPTLSGGAGGVLPVCHVW